MSLSVESSSASRTRSSPTRSRPIESAQPSASTPDKTHTVSRGDTLSHIAKANNVGLNDLIKANPQISNPDRIYPGDVVNLPAARRDSVADRSAAAHSRHTTLSTGAGPRPQSGGLSPETLAARFNTGNLSRGANGQPVSDLQQQLQQLGHNPGAIDGVFGGQTHAAVQSFQRSQNLTADGVVGPKTQAALQNPQAPRTVTTPAGTPGTAPNLQVYPPGSPEQRALFRDAARMIGVPESWADSAGLHNILRRESGGKVGVPNYTYGDRARDPSQWASVHNELKNGRITARSSATGLGQLLLSNVERYYPAGRAGIGDPVQEAAGMLAYIKDRYGNPDNAWRLYGTRHEGY